jgi:hypothetical protein
MHNNIMNSHLSKYRPHTCLQNQRSCLLLGHVTRSMSSMCRNTHGKHPLSCGLPYIVMYITHAITYDSLM